MYCLPLKFAFQLLLCYRFCVTFHSDSIPHRSSNKANDIVMCVNILLHLKLVYRENS